MDSRKSISEAHVKSRGEIWRDSVVGSLAIIAISLGLTQLGDSEPTQTSPSIENTSDTTDYWYLPLID